LVPPRQSNASFAYVYRPIFYTNRIWNIKIYDRQSATMTIIIHIIARSNSNKNAGVPSKVTKNKSLFVWHLLRSVHTTCNKLLYVRPIWMWYNLYFFRVCHFISSRYIIMLTIDIYFHIYSYVSSFKLYALDNIIQ